MSNVRVCRQVGIAVWLIGIAVLSLGIGCLLTSRWTGPAAQSLTRFWTTRPQTLSLPLAAGLASGESLRSDLVTVGTPVFYYDTTDDRWRQVGVVQRIVPTTNTASSKSSPTGAAADALVQISWFDPQLPTDSLQWQAHHFRGSMNETLAILLPEDKRRRLQTHVRAALEIHGAALADQFQPLLERSLRESLPVVQRQLIVSLRDRRPQLEQVRDRWRAQWADENLGPLAKEQIWPIVSRHSDPLAYEIGRELWGRASIWSFTWRAAYDRSPLPRKDLMREEWERFVVDEAIPVLESHADEIATALRAMLTDLATDPTIRSELGDALDVLWDDPATGQLVRDVLRDTLIDNHELHQVWTAVWTSGEATQALDQAGQLIEPLVRQWGEEMFGSPETGIDPGFARVLRSQILGKDKRWIVVQQSNHAEQRIVPAPTAAAYPLLPADGLEFP